MATPINNGPPQARRRSVQIEISPVVEKINLDLMLKISDSGKKTGSQRSRKLREIRSHASSKMISARGTVKSRNFEPKVD